jgi:hypothetical protein
MKNTRHLFGILFIASGAGLGAQELSPRPISKAKGGESAKPDQLFNRDPLKPKPYPWNLAGAPLELRTTALRLPDWTTPKNHAGIQPASPNAMPANAASETIRLTPQTIDAEAMPNPRSTAPKKTPD